jgi:hypothetical protein
MNLNELWKNRFVLPASLILIIGGLFILGRDLLRAISSFLWGTQLATTTKTGGLVQLEIIALVEDYPVKLGSFNWLAGGLLAALGLFSLIMVMKHRPTK